MKIVQKPTDELIPYGKNAKRHSSEQVKNVAESIRRFGIVQPVVVDKKGVIVIGHCRVLACKKLGIKSVPCVCVSDLTDEQVKALRIVDNKTNESPWDMGFLKEEIEKIDLSDFDFDFNLEIEKNQEKEKKVKGEIPFTEVLGEENNYIVLKFNNDVDWLQLESIFDIPNVKAYSTRKDGKIEKNMVRAGIGRVVDGTDFLNKIGVSL